MLGHPPPLLRADPTRGSETGAVRGPRWHKSRGLRIGQTTRSRALGDERHSRERVQGKDKGQWREANRRQLQTAILSNLHPHPHPSTLLQLLKLFAHFFGKSRSPAVCFRKSVLGQCQWGKSSFDPSTLLSSPPPPPPLSRAAPPLWSCNGPRARWGFVDQALNHGLFWPLSWMRSKPQ